MPKPGQFEPNPQFRWIKFIGIFRLRFSYASVTFPSSWVFINLLRSA